MASADRKRYGEFDRLNGDNYHTWKFNIKMVLKMKDLWDIVTGQETIPEDASAAERLKFKKRNDRAHSEICLAVTESIQVYVRNTDTGREAWKALEDHFEEKTLSRKINLRQKLYSTKLVSGTMVDHVNQLKTICEHLESIGDIITENDMVMVLLTSLPTQYNNLITTLETLKEEQLTWNYVRDRVIAEYQRKQEEKAERNSKKVLAEKQHDALFSQGGGNSKKGGKSIKFKCHYCNKKGHFQRDCPKKAADNAKKAADANNVEDEDSSFCEDISKLEIATCSWDYDSEIALAADNDDEKSVGDDSWWVDSGCSRHMSGDQNDFEEIEELEKPVNVKLADKSFIPAEGKGSVRILLVDENGQKVPVLLKNVLYVPKLKKKLVSVSMFDDNGATVIFKNGGCTVIAGGKRFVFGEKVGNLYRVRTAVAESCNLSVSTPSKNSLELWHLRLGHLNIQDVKKLSTEKMVEGLTIENSRVSIANCEGCCLGKQSRLPFPKKSSKKKDNVLDLVHSDVCGPLNIASVGGSLYFTTLIDDHSNFLWVYMLKQKSDFLDVFMEWIAMIENQTERKVKEFRSDNGGEYVSKEFKKVCKERGIALQPTIPYTPQQNGVAERMNRTIMENVRATLYHLNLPLSLWAEAVSTIVYLRNMSPTSSFKGVTPFEKLFAVKPNVGHLRVFGCTAYAHVPDQKRRKLDPKAVKGIFVGYPTGSKGYKIYIPETRQMIRSRDVKFVENQFQQRQSGKDEQVKLDLVPDAEVISQPSSSAKPLPVDRVRISDDVCNSDDDVVSDNDEIVPVPDILRPIRNRRKPDYYVACAADAAAHEADPKSFKQASKSANKSKWEKAMQEELLSLKKHNTWELVDLPKGKNLVGCKWVYKTKRDANGEIDRFKARLVAQGFSQEQGVDYDEVFAPVARYDSIRSVLAVGTQLDLEIHQMDVRSAYLNGKLEEEIFMKQPPGFVDKTHPHKVCKLNASLYGLKQSARCWNLVIDRYFKSKNFIQNLADPCVYYKFEVNENGEEVIIIVAIYVDDSILCSNKMSVLNLVKQQLSERFEMDNRGEIHYILGMSVHRDRQQKILTIDQKAYLENVLAKFGMDDCKSIATPLDSSVNLVSRAEDEESFDVTLYQSAIGSLNYAAICTRPDLATVVGKLGKFMQNPGKEHWVAVKRVLRYIKGTLTHGLVYRCSENFRLYGYSDADYAGCTETRKSTSGLVFLLGQCTISWRSKKQSIIAQSSTESEYVALCSAAQEAVWLRRLLAGIGFKQEGPTIIHEDNQSAISLSRNPRDHSRTKHIDVKFHYIRKAIEDKIVDVQYLCTTEMLADTLTKALPLPKFQKFRDGMNVSETKMS